MQLEFLPITHDELPVRKTFEIGGINYIFEFNYNDVHDIYTMMIYDGDGNILLATKLCYLSDALDAVCEGLNIDKKIVPLNEVDASKSYPEIMRLGSSNFSSVKVCLV